MYRSLIAVLAMLIVASAAAAPEVRAQPAPRDQMEAGLFFSEANGHYLLVWVEDRGAGNRIFARRVRSNGLPIGSEWELTGATGAGAMAGQKGDQRQPAVVDGLVVWSELAPGGTDYDVYAQKLFGNFRAYGRPAVIAGGAGNQAHPAVAPLGRGTEWLVVWSEDANDAGDVRGQRISAALTPRSNVIEIATGAGVAEDPTIARDLFDSNTLLVLFTDDRNGNKDIFGTRVTESGLPRGGPLGGAFEVIVSPEDDYSPALVSTPSDRSVAGGVERPSARTQDIVLWTRDHVADGPDVMGLRLNNNGLPYGEPFVVAGGPGRQSTPAGELLVGGREWLVAWEDDSTGTLDILGVELGVNGIIRRAVRTLSGD